MATRTTRTTRAQAPVQAENDVRLQIFNSFMACSHRDTDKIKEIHEQMRQKDPLFFSHLACWYKNGGGDLRDHNEVFAAMLLTDPYVENREVGLALFRDLPVFMKNKVVGFIKGKTVKIREKTGNKIKKGKKQIDEVKITEKKVGLNATLPTSLKTEIENFLQWLEKDPARFDAAALRNASALKDLYYAKGKHCFKHGERANKIIFKKEYPEDSKLNVFKKISGAKSPEEAAKLIVENKIPYTIAVGLVEKVTPSVLVALINSMSSQELINNIASLKEKGAMDNPDTKKLIEGKLEKAKKGKVSALKSNTAVSTGRIKDEALEKKLTDIADVQIKKSGVIKIPTAIFVDRSGSMEAAIEVGKKAAALVSGVSEADLFVVAFDDAPMPIVAQGKAMSDWEKAFRPVRSGGQTSMGCALQYLLTNKKYVEQIVVITDEGENAHPFFHEVYPKYIEEMKITPHVVVINVAGGHAGQFSSFLKAANISFDTYKPDGNDYYGLPGLVSLLSRKSKLDLIMEIMATPLATRNGFKL